MSENVRKPQITGWWFFWLTLYCCRLVTRTVLQAPCTNATIATRLPLLCVSEWTLRYLCSQSFIELERVVSVADVRRRSDEGRRCRDTRRRGAGSVERRWHEVVHCQPTDDAQWQSATGQMWTVGVQRSQCRPSFLSLWLTHDVYTYKRRVCSMLQEKAKIHRTQSINQSIRIFKWRK